MSGTAKRYAYSHDEETYFDGGDSREDALVESDGEPGATVYTGEKVHYSGKAFAPAAADYLIERMQEDAADEVGECSEGWLYNLTPEVIADLDKRIVECIDLWLHVHGNEHRFWTVEDVQAHVIPDAVARKAT